MYKVFEQLLVEANMEKTGVGSFILAMCSAATRWRHCLAIHSRPKKLPSYPQYFLYFWYFSKLCRQCLFCFTGGFPNPFKKT